VVRGPIASKLINQLLLATDWGELDYLLVDMPPGTGDIQITLSQSACMSGAVVVTTPHQLSLVDAAKGGSVVFLLVRLFLRFRPAYCLLLFTYAASCCIPQVLPCSRSSRSPPLLW
jgi:hypothetical protein